jgi:extensin-like protein
MSWASRRARLRYQQERWLMALRREGASLRLGARRALGSTLFASAWVGTWLLSVWLLGALVVYDDASALDGPHDEGAVTSAGTSGTPDVVVAANQPASLRTGEPIVPRVSRAYAFDEMPREVRGKVACPDVGLTEYAGASVQFVPAARVAVPFRGHLVELERVVREVSKEVYGRAPSALLVAASYDCRAVTGNRARLSEHALGNAIDITAFRFDADAGQPAFEVRVDEHWKADGDEVVERHARFLRALTQALIARDVSRTLLGPAHPDHHDHFHFDMAPHHFVHL